MIYSMLQNKCIIHQRAITSLVLFSICYGDSTLQGVDQRFYDLMFNDIRNIFSVDNIIMYFI